MNYSLIERQANYLSNLKYNLHNARKLEGLDVSDWKNLEDRWLIKVDIDKNDEIINEEITFKGLWILFVYDRDH